MNVSRIARLLIAGVMMSAVAVPVIAEDMLHGDEAIAKRKELMKENGGAMKAASTASGADAVAAAQTLVDNFTALSDLWPEDSATGDTKALPTVWSDSEGFMVAMEDSLKASQVLLAAAESGDAEAYGAAMKALGGTCGACHTKYRVAKQ